MKSNNKNTYLVISILILLLVFFIGCSNGKTVEEKNEICMEGCQQIGWEAGKWLQGQECNCYNRSLSLGNFSTGEK